MSKNPQNDIESIWKLANSPVNYTKIVVRDIGTNGQFRKTVKSHFHQTDRHFLNSLFKPISKILNPRYYSK